MDTNNASFQEWVRTQINAREWSLQETAQRSGVDASNVGMLLSGKIHQPTLRMATRLCKAFGLSLPQVLASWLGRTHVSALQRADETSLPSTVTTVNDVHNLIAWAHTNWEQTCDQLAVMLNGVGSPLQAAQQQVQLEDEHCFIGPEDRLVFNVRAVEKLFSDSHPLLDYPHTFPLYAILSIYRERGVLLLNDARQYLRLLLAMPAEGEPRRRGQRHLLTLSPAKLSNLQAGKGERVLLNDLLLLDEQLGQHGQLLGMYWDAFEFQEWLRSYQQPEEKRRVLFGPWKDDIELAVQFLLLCRWLHLAELKPDQCFCY